MEPYRRLEGKVLQLAITESIKFSKSIIPPSLMEVTKWLSVRSLSELADLQSVKPDESELIDRDSTGDQIDRSWFYQRERDHI